MVTIFKGLQLDIGAPPQFMDFRYAVQDPVARHLPPRPLRRPDGRRADGRVLRALDVPRHRGPDVRRHRGRHQPARAGAARPPSPARCPRDARRTARGRSRSRTTTRGDAHPRAASSSSRARPPRSSSTRSGRARVSDYAGPLLSDLDFGAFSHSALVRLADEVCLQMHLLVLGFLRALAQRGDAAQVREIATKQLVGIAGVAAERLHRALDLTARRGRACSARWRCTPCSTPRRTSTPPLDDRLRPGDGRARRTTTAAGSRSAAPTPRAPLQAIVQAVDPTARRRGRGNRRATGPRASCARPDPHPKPRRSS